MVKADAEGLIWIVVALFWVIAQIAGAAAQKKRSQQRPPSVRGAEREAPPDPFAELLRKMAGADELRVEPPGFAEEEEPEEVPVFPFENAWKPGEIEALPDIPPSRPEPLSQGEMYAAPLPAADVAAARPETEARPDMSAFRSSVPSIRLPAMTLRIDTPSYAEASTGKQGRGGRLHLRNRRALRRAMLHQMVFNPPKALE